MDELQRWVDRRIEEDPKVAAISNDARLFASLVDEPGWQRLRRRVEQEREKFIYNLGQRLVNGEPFDQRHLDFERGWYAAMEWFTGTPEKAMGSFEQAAKLAYAKAIVDLQTDSSTSPPYE